MMAGQSHTLGERIESAIAEVEARTRRSASAAIGLGVILGVVVVIGGVGVFILTWAILNRLLA